jgi:hypothetical protein
LTCKKKDCIYDNKIKTDWGLPFLSSLFMLSSPSDFDQVSLPKAINTPAPKTYAAVVATPVNKQVEN